MPKLDVLLKDQNSSDIKVAQKAQVELGMLFVNGSSSLAKDIKKALELFIKAASSGYALAQRLVGEIYLGKWKEMGFIEKNHKIALEWLKKAAAQNDPLSQVTLGIIYIKGCEGININYGFAMRYLEEAIRNKSSNQKNIQHANHALGWIFQHTEGVQKDLKKALEHYTAAATFGSLTDQLYLAELYAGKHIDDGYQIKDDKKSFYWYQMAANQGDPGAQLQLAEKYMHGIGVEKSEALAFAYYEKMISSQDPIFVAEAKYNLGTMLFHGIGVVKNISLSLQYFIDYISLVGFEKVPYEILTFVADNYNSGEIVAHDLKKAIELYIIAIKKEDLTNEGEADYQLGLLYEKEKVLENDYHKAFKTALDHFLISASSVKRKGHYALAQYKLGSLFEYGVEKEGSTLLEQDYYKAFQWYKKSAMQSNIDGLYKLGIMYEYGRGVEKDIRMAVNIYRIASQKGHIEAQYSLGWLYQIGETLNEYTPHQRHKIAYGLYHMAAMQGHSKAKKEMEKLSSFLLDEPQNLHDLKSELELYKANKNHEQLNDLIRNEVFSFSWNEIEILQKENKLDVILPKVYQFLEFKIMGKDSEHDLAQFFMDYKTIFNDEYRTNIGFGFERIKYWFGLANQYVVGNENCEKNTQKAFDFYSASANLGYPNAQLMLAEIYYGEYSKDGFLNKDYKKAIYWYQKAADQNHPLAQWKLGVMLEKHLDSQNYDLAIKWYEKVLINKSSSKEMIALAQHNLAVIYFYGKGVEKNLKKSFELFSLAYNNNPFQTKTICNLAKFYEGGLGEGITEKDLKKAYELYSSITNQHENNGRGEINYRLGIYYKKGIYIDKNVDKAIKYFTESAMQEFADAQYMLAEIYYGEYINDGFLTKNYKQATYWYQKAAEHNHPFAQWKLGVILEYGYDCEKNYKAAIECYKKVINNSLSSNDIKAVALNNLGSICLKEKSSENDKLQAFRYFYRAHSHSPLHAGIACALGKFYEGLHGNIIKINYTRAFKLYSLAKEQKDHTNIGQADYRLGCLYETGKIVDEQNSIATPKKAFEHFTISAKLHYAEAQNKLGEVYLIGLLNNKKDLEKAFYWFNKAAEQDNSLGLYNLAQMYEHGFHVKKDPLKACHFYAKSHHRGNKEAAYKYGLICQVHASSICLKTDTDRILQKKYYLNAIKWYKVAFKGGHSVAITKIKEIEQYLPKENENMEIVANLEQVTLQNANLVMAHHEVCGPLLDKKHRIEMIKLFPRLNSLREVLAKEMRESVLIAKNGGVDKIQGYIKSVGNSIADHFSLPLISGVIKLASSGLQAFVNTLEKNKKQLVLDSIPINEEEFYTEFGLQIAEWIHEFKQNYTFIFSDKLIENYTSKDEKLLAKLAVLIAWKSIGTDIRLDDQNPTMDSLDLVVKMVKSIQIDFGFKEALYKFENEKSCKKGIIFFFKNGVSKLLGQKESSPAVAALFNMAENGVPTLVKNETALLQAKH